MTQQTKLQIKTTGVDHVVLWVRDLARSKAFYMDLLGMTVAHESDWQAFLWCGSQQVALFEAGKVGVTVQKGSLNHMALLMEPASYEETKARLNEEGIEVMGRSGDPTCIYFDDPDGHRLQLLYKGHD
ncbi:MAG: metallothiol transferase [Chloroflexi bacterium]|jgi:catechol-2,3-dioxygenase|nr:MAG: metallothiol transferase [Chloroflexota bacterium]